MNAARLFNKLKHQPFAFYAAVVAAACFASSTSATEIDLPEVAPRNTIHVQAETYASVQRGAYDVLAFDGNCQLTQGDLSLQAQEITLWIERNSIGNASHPGKVICMAEGSVSIAWGDGRKLQDHRWMGRLFSYYPCLLYTSPSPRDLSTSRMPSSA